MILCLCEGVNDRTVERVIDGGAATVAEIGERCGAGTGCGRCSCDLKDLLERGRANAKATGPNDKVLAK